MTVHSYGSFLLIQRLTVFVKPNGVGPNDMPRDRKVTGSSDVDARVTSLLMQKEANGPISRA